jgi:hypothetical protein
MAGLDVGAKDGKDRPVGHVLEFNRILEVVEEENRVQQVPSRCEGKGKGVRQGGKPIPLIRVSTVGGEEISAFHVSEGAETLAQCIEIERRGGRFAQEDENLPEVFLEEVLGERQRMGQDLAEGIIEREGTWWPRGPGHRLEFRFELQEEGRFSDVRRAVDENRGTDAGFAFEAHSQQRGQFLLAAEELPRAKRRFGPITPQETHYENSNPEITIRIM